MIWILDFRFWILDRRKTSGFSMPHYYHANPKSKIGGPTTGGFFFNPKSKI